MPYALVEPSGRVAQIAEAPFPVGPELRWVEADESLTERHRYVDGAFFPPRPSPYHVFDVGAGAWVEDAALKRAAIVPPSITPRQMLIGLMTQGMITEAEAIAAARGGSVPASVQRIFDGLPSAADRAAAAITWAKMTVVERDHPMASALAEANGLSESDVDAFFQACAKI